MTEVQEKIKVFAVCGPTASGKTSLSVTLAKKLHAEVVSCDSMQIYRGMEIGTAKPTADEMQGVPHHLMGFQDPAEPFSVSDYVALAGKVIEDIRARGKNVLLVGGTGLYARSLLKAVPFTENSRDDEIRGNLEAEFAADGIEPLYARLKELDPEGAEGIHPNNMRRVIRALEYCMVTGEPFSKQAKDSKAVESPYDGKMLVLSFRDRETLYGRINLRVEQMFADGLLKEAEDYFKRYGTPGQTSVQAIGYKELFPYFEGQCSLDEAKEN
ncbi:tRNA (adenosine(37)-N6)-dimethylallyltransferase MiaA, partial [Hominenteromicrobium sp.]